MKKLIVVGLLVTSLASAFSIDDKNELSILGGDGAQKGFSGNTLPVGNTGKQGLVHGFKRGFVGGVQYQRAITPKLSLGIQAQTNDTYSVLFGVRF